MKQRIETLLAIPDDADGGDGVHVYWDGWTGVVDYDAPLTSAPVQIFPGRSPAKGWGRAPWGDGHPTGIAPRTKLLAGWGQHRWGQDPWGAWPFYLPLRFDAPRGYGQAKIGAVIHGPTGNTVGSPLEFGVLISSDPPRPLGSLVRVSYDTELDRLTFKGTLLAEV